MNTLEGEALMEEAICSLGRIRGLLREAQDTTISPYAPVWEKSSAILRQLLAQTGGQMPETLHMGSLVNSISFQVDAAYVTDRDGVLDQLSRTPASLRSLLGLTPATCATLPTTALRSILQDLTCSSFSSTPSVTLPVPIVLNGIEFSKLPTPYAIWGVGFPQLSVPSVVALGPFLLQRWLVGRDCSKQFFKSDMEAQQFSASGSATSLHLLGSFESAVG